jgi:hypothetical protein
VDVLHERVLERGGVIDVTDDRRDRGKPGPLRGAPTPFARYELVAIVAEGPHEDRLQYAQLPHRCGQRRERVLVETAARLMGTRDDAAHRDLGEAQRTGLARRRLRRDQGSETATETATARHH